MPAAVAVIEPLTLRWRGKGSTTVLLSLARCLLYIGTCIGDSYTFENIYWLIFQNSISVNVFFYHCLPLWISFFLCLSLWLLVSLSLFSSSLPLSYFPSSLSLFFLSFSPFIFSPSLPLSSFPFLSLSLPFCPPLSIFSLSFYLPNEISNLVLSSIRTCSFSLSLHFFIQNGSS